MYGKYFLGYVAIEVMPGIELPSDTLGYRHTHRSLSFICISSGSIGQFCTARWRLHLRWNLVTLSRRPCVGQFFQKSCGGCSLSWSSGILCSTSSRTASIGLFDTIISSDSSHRSIFSYRCHAYPLNISCLN